VGAIKSLTTGLPSLARSIAQNESVQELRDRALHGLGDAAARIARSELVPKFIAAPAELLASVLAPRCSDSRGADRDGRPEPEHRYEVSAPANLHVAEPTHAPDAVQTPAPAQAHNARASEMAASSDLPHAEPVEDRLRRPKSGADKPGAHVDKPKAKARKADGASAASGSADRKKAGAAGRKAAEGQRQETRDRGG